MKKRDVVKEEYVRSDPCVMVRMKRSLMKAIDSRGHPKDFKGEKMFPCFT